jgi:hypothetical protein
MMITMHPVTFRNTVILSAALDQNAVLVYFVEDAIHTQCCLVFRAGAQLNVLKVLKRAIVAELQRA